MSNSFNFIPTTLTDDATDLISGVELPLFKELAYDFTTGQLLTQAGKYYYVTGNEALKVWIWKVLYTSRFTYLAYTTNYGNELYTLFGRYIRGDVLYSEIKRMIEEALLCNPYITFLSDFKVERQLAKVVCTFGVNTIYGTIAQSYIYEE